MKLHRKWVKLRKYIDFCVVFWKITTPGKKIHDHWLVTVVTHPMYVTTCKRLRLLGLSIRPPAWGICQNQMSDQARTILVFNSIPLITALPKKGGCYKVGFWLLFNLFGDTSASLIVFGLSARLVFDLQRILFQRISFQKYYFSARLVFDLQRILYQRISSQKILFLQRVSKNLMRLS